MGSNIYYNFFPYSGKNATATFTSTTVTSGYIPNQSGVIYMATGVVYYLPTVTTTTVPILNADNRRVVDVQKRRVKKIPKAKTQTETLEKEVYFDWDSKTKQTP